MCSSPLLLSETRGQPRGPRVVKVIPGVAVECEAALRAEKAGPQCEHGCEFDRGHSPTGGSPSPFARSVDTTPLGCPDRPSTRVEGRVWMIGIRVVPGRRRSPAGARIRRRSVAAAHIVRREEAPKASSGWWTRMLHDTGWHASHPSRKPVPCRSARVATRPESSISALRARPRAEKARFQLRAHVRVRKKLDFSSDRTPTFQF